VAAARPPHASAEQADPHGMTIALQPGRVRPHTEERMSMDDRITHHPIESLADLADRIPDFYARLARFGDRRSGRAGRGARSARWLGAGLVIGAGLTALTSPTTGPDVRRRLRAGARRIRDRVRSRLDAAQAKATAESSIE